MELEGSVGVEGWFLTQERTLRIPLAQFDQPLRARCQGSLGGLSRLGPGAKTEASTVAEAESIRISLSVALILS